MKTKRRSGHATSDLRARTLIKKMQRITFARTTTPDRLAVHVTRTVDPKRPQDWERWTHRIETIDGRLQPWVIRYTEAHDMKTLREALCIVLELLRHASTHDAIATDVALNERARQSDAQQAMTKRHKVIAEEGQAILRHYAEKLLTEKPGRPLAEVARLIPEASS